MSLATKVHGVASSETAERERCLRSVIAELKDQISNLEDELREAEDELENLRLRPQETENRRVRQIAREILAMPFMTGAIWDLAMRVVGDGADEEEASELEYYHEQRMREMNLNAGGVA